MLLLLLTASWCRWWWRWCSCGVSTC